MVLKAIIFCSICWHWLDLVKTWHAHIPAPSLAAEQACGLASGAGPEVAPSQKPTTVRTSLNVPRLSKLDHIFVKFAYYLIYLYRNADLKDCSLSNSSNNLHLVVWCKAQ